MPTLSYPAAEVRRHDRDRFLTALFAPPDRREALLALYAFNSALARVRETVSEPMMGEIRLQWWWDRVAAIYQGARPDDDAVAAALSDAIAAHGLTRAHFETLIEGRRRDLDDRPPDDLDALVRYAEETSGALVRLALEVLGVGDDGVAGEAGREVGVAWALRGLVRAVPYHAAQGRSFLPADLCRDAGLDAERPLLRPGDRALGAVIARMAGRATEHLARSRARPVARAAVPALLPATLADADLSVLAKAGFDPFDRRVAAGGIGRLLRLAVNGARGRF